MSDHFAKEAHRLTHDAVLVEAVNRAQLEAMKALVTVDAGDALAVMKLQARVQAFDDILTVLEAAILSQAQPAGIAVP